MGLTRKGPQLVRQFVPHLKVVMERHTDYLVTVWDGRYGDGFSYHRTVRITEHLLSGSCDVRVLGGEDIGIYPTFDRAAADVLAFELWHKETDEGKRQWQEWKKQQPKKVKA